MVKTAKEDITSHSSPKLIKLCAVVPKEKTITIP